MRSPGIRSTAALTSKAAPGAMSDYAKYIADGIPKTEAPRNVAVVGAGIAGMVAASLLADAGHRVTIFEASQRIGGRVMTVRAPFSHGLYGEAGAMRIPSFYRLTLDYIAKLGLQTSEFVNHDKKGNEYIFVNGVKQRRSEYNANNGRGLKYPLIPGEEGQTAETLLAAALLSISSYVGTDSLDGYLHNRWADVIAKYGEYTVREFLKQQTFYSEGAIEMIEVLLDLESRSDQSLIQQIVELNDHGAGVQYFEITGGMDLLPAALMQRLAARDVRVAFGHRLTEIDQDAARACVTLRFETDEPGQGPAPPDVTCDAAIVTIPFPGMRYVKVRPMLSHNKRKAIRELHYDASTKILLQFKTRFWETRDGIYGGNTTTDLPSRFIYYPSHGFDTKDGGVVITSYTWGDEARGWDALSREHQIQRTLDDVATIHGEYVKQELVAGFVQSWATDRYAYGEAAMFYGGQLEELQPYIPVAEGNIHFAGEHTSLKHAWLEGSIESGIRTALEVAG